MLTGTVTESLCKQLGVESYDYHYMDWYQIPKLLDRRGEAAFSVAIRFDFLLSSATALPIL